MELLPEPVGPVTSTRPRGLSAWATITAGSLSCSAVGTVRGRRRRASAVRHCCLKMFTRIRTMSRKETAKSASPEVLSSSSSSLPASSAAAASVSSAVRGSSPTGVSTPWSRTVGGRPTVR